MDQPTDIPNRLSLKNLLRICIYIYYLGYCTYVATRPIFHVYQMLLGYHTALMTSQMQRFLQRLVILRIEYEVKVVTQLVKIVYT